MKKFYNILLSVLTASILVTACNPADFGDINKDPNNPSTAFTNYLFTSACTYVPYFVLGNGSDLLVSDEGPAIFPSPRTTSTVPWPLPLPTLR